VQGPWLGCNADFNPLRPIFCQSAKRSSLLYTCPVAPICTIRRSADDEFLIYELQSDGKNGFKIPPEKRLTSARNFLIIYVHENN